MRRLGTQDAPDELRLAGSAVRAGRPILHAVHVRNVMNRGARCPIVASTAASPGRLPQRNCGARAFSGEVDTASPQENAAVQNTERKSASAVDFAGASGAAMPLQSGAPSFVSQSASASPQKSWTQAHPTAPGCGAASCLRTGLRIAASNMGHGLSLLENITMRFLVITLVAATSLALGGCGSRTGQRVGGAAAGAGAGALVAGPVGAVVGGAAGAVSGPSVARAFR